MRQPPSVEQLVETLDLRMHPEGGFYTRSFKSDDSLPVDVLPARFARQPDARPVSTAIYYLLPAGGVSRLHRIAADELWHFYLGAPLVVAEIRPDGSLHETPLGPDVANGQRPQHAVRPGAWFGAWSTAAEDDEAPYSLVGCTVAPGFDFADFELADRDTLLEQFPHAAELIGRLT